MLMAMPPQASGIEISHLYDISVFYLAFHGQNDLDLMKALASFYEHLLPDLVRPTSHLSEIQNRSDSLRIGFFSKNVHDHPITHCFSGLFEFISQQKGVSAFLISPMGFELSAIQGTYANFVGEKIPCLGGYQSARQLLEDLKLDIIIYTDIGMDPLSYFLASTRLGLIQCSVPGHPVTTGISNVDYYFSPTLAEPPDAAVQYSEGLVLIDDNYVNYPRLQLPDYELSPADIGLPDGKNYYFCPIMLQKLHPEFYIEMAKILRRDPDAIVVMFNSERMPWVDVVRRCMSQTLTLDEVERIVFLPYIHDKKRFIASLRCADVVLDSFHFGLGSTFTFIIEAGVPFVSWPGETLRGRTGLYMSRLLGTPELICEDRGEYAARAVEIAHDKNLRERMQAAYSLNKHKVFANVGGMQEFYKKLTQVLSLSRQRTASAVC